MQKVIMSLKLLVFYCHANKSKNKNHSMNESKDLRDKGKVKINNKTVTRTHCAPFQCKLKFKENSTQIY